MRHAIERFGSIDVLINNAGSATPTPPLEATKEDWLKTFDDNFFSSVLCSTAAAKIMQAKGSGRIVNNASVRGLAHGGRSGIIAYSAAKAALISFTKTLAKELAPAITVNAVAPGFTFTSIFDDVPESTKADYIDGALIKRWITVEEIAEAFLYLACADAVTGEVLVVDGGWNLR